MNLAPLSHPVVELVNFRERYCRAYNCTETEFEEHLLAKVLFKRARLLQKILTPLNGDFLHAERVLVRHVGKNEAIRETQLDVDFYQHKYVVGSFLREDLKVRISGVRLLQIAKRLLSE